MPSERGPSWPKTWRVLTDIPEKDAIIQEKQQMSGKRKGSAKAYSAARAAAARALVATKKAKPSPVNDDDTCTCMLCDEPFSNSLPGENGCSSLHAQCGHMRTAHLATNVLCAIMF